MAESDKPRRWSGHASSSAREPSPRLRATLLGVAAAGTAVLALNGLFPFLPASTETSTRTGLISEPAAGQGVAADAGFVWVTASAYGGEFLGGDTACGEVLEPTSRIVAHRDLACGTPLNVRVEDTTVMATVGDRGPFVEGRELDLAPGVWRGLGYDSIADFGVRGVQVQLIDG